MRDPFRSWVETRCLERWGAPSQSWQALVPDGSSRRLFRVRAGKHSLVALSNPGETGENDAYWHIGGHLRLRGVLVPALYEYERARGWMVLEDLGDRNLQEMVGSVSSQEEILGLYGPVLNALLTLQLKGREGFQEGWCYQTKRYDRALMLERESAYFLNAFLKGYWGWGGDEGPLLKELCVLADLASKAPADFLLHRDFQSRNILLPSRGSPHVIDFQGARWGPLQYDVAALVIDPYVDLGPETRDAVLKAYLDALEASGVMSAEAFMAHYPFMVLHRNLQILGAFAFLGGVKKKTFFLQWIPPALAHLHVLLQSHPAWPCPRLKDQVDKALDGLPPPARA